VALDEGGHPREIPGLIVETDDDVRRQSQAMNRRAVRLEERAREKAGA
jgi:hypothetical protein